MHRFIISLLLLLIYRGEASFSADCMESDGHLNIKPGTACKVTGADVRIESVTFGEASELVINEQSTVTIEWDVEVPPLSKLTLAPGTLVTVNGDLTIHHGLIMDLYATLNVLDTFHMLPGSRGSFSGSVRVYVQDLVMDPGSILSGDGGSSYSTVALGFPSVPNLGGTQTSVNPSMPSFSLPYFNSPRPSAHGSAVSPSHEGSPGTDANGKVGGAGGAMIRIEAEHTMILDGLITSDGETVLDKGTGAGGTITLTTRLLKHSSGVVRANGGTSNIAGGGGGGGKIAIKCQYSEFVDMDHATSPLGISVEANGNGQGAGTIWYDCGTMRATLRLGTDNTLPLGSEVYVDIQDFQNIIVREIDVGNNILVMSTQKSHANTNYEFRYWNFKSKIRAHALMFSGKVYPRSYPDPSSEACFDYIIRAGCVPQQEKYAIFDEYIDFLGDLEVYLPETTTIYTGFLSAASLNIYGVNVDMQGLDMFVEGLSVRNLSIESWCEVRVSNSVAIVDTLIVKGNFILWMPTDIALTVANLYTGEHGRIAASSSKYFRHGCGDAVLSYAGCSAANNCLGTAYKPYGVFFDVLESGVLYSCTPSSGTSSYFHLTVTSIISHAGIITASSGSTHSTGGGIRMSLEKVVHMSGMVSISGGLSTDVGPSGGRAMITCKEDPYNAMFHLKIKAEGGCTATGCGATGTVFLNCGYFQNYLKVVTHEPPTHLPSPTHIIIDRDYILQTIEVSGKANLYFTSVDNNPYKFEVKRIIASVPPRIQKGSKIRLKLGQSEPHQLPTASSINALTAAYESQAIQRQEQLAQLLADLGAKYAQQLALLSDLHIESTAYRYCRHMLNMCLADECSGQSTRFTRTGRSKVGIRMSVDTFKNPLDVRTATETMLDTLSNFYGLEKEEIIFSDPVESGTRIINVTANVNARVAERTRRVLLQTSSRIDDSPVESCFKRVNL